MKQDIIPGADIGTAENFAARGFHGMRGKAVIAAAGFGPAAGRKPEQPLAPMLRFKGIVPLLAQGCAVGAHPGILPRPHAGPGHPPVFGGCRCISIIMQMAVISQLYDIAPCRFTGILAGVA